LQRRNGTCVTAIGADPPSPTHPPSLPARKSGAGYSGLSSPTAREFIANSLPTFANPNYQRATRLRERFLSFRECFAAEKEFPQGGTYELACLSCPILGLPGEIRSIVSLHRSTFGSKLESSDVCFAEPVRHKLTAVRTAFRYSSLFGGGRRGTRIGRTGLCLSGKESFGQFSKGVASPREKGDCYSKWKWSRVEAMPRSDDRRELSGLLPLAVVTCQTESIRVCRAAHKTMKLKWPTSLIAMHARKSAMLREIVTRREIRG